MKQKELKPFNHEYWILKALRELRSPTSEVPICALIVRDNNLISKAINQTEALSDASAHAEIIAIREASEILKNWRLTNCTLYTTLEPCSMCAGAILNSRISKIVFSAYDLNSGACGSVINLFYELGKQKQIEIIGGILENEASKILKEFFKKFRNSST